MSTNASIGDIEHYNIGGEPRPDVTPPQSEIEQMIQHVIKAHALYVRCTGVPWMREFDALGLELDEAGFLARCWAARFGGDE